MKKLFTSLFACTLFAVGASAQSIDPAPYCFPAFDPANNAGSTDNYIYEVKLGTFDNITPTLFNDSSYVFYNNLAPITVHVSPVDLFHFQMVIGNGGPLGAHATANVYIDYNHNNVFDSIENVYQSTGYTSAAILNAPTPLPTTALYGNTRMRIQWVSGLSSDPCQSSFTPSQDFGAVADYIVSITGTYPLATTTFATSINPTNAALNGLINANYSTSSLDSFQYGSTSAYGTTVATNSVWALTDSTVKTVITGLTPGATYHYRVKGTNANGTNYGRDTTFTTPLTSGISGQENLMHVNVYPNPANDILHIDNLKHTASYSILNIAGDVIVKGKLLPGNNKLSINILSSGNYILEIHNDQGEKSSIKLVK